MLYYNVYSNFGLALRMVRFLALCLLALLSPLSWSQGLVVSTHPVYLIAQQVTQGVEQPTLLLGNQSGHDVQLTPEHRKMVQDASLVIWLGQAHEAPLQKLLANQSKAISILDSGIMKILPQRTTRGAPLPNTMDTHVWLDPNNAVRIGFFIAALRSQQYPQHRAAYWQNAKKFAHDLLKVARPYQRSRNSYHYWSYHDAYQYLEQPLHLKFAGAMTDEPHVAPTIAQIKYLNDHRPQRQMCLLAEAHASQNQYQKINPVRFQAVDESMSTEKNFVQAWQNLAIQVQKCVANAQK